MLEISGLFGIGKALLAAVPKIAVMAPGGGQGGADEPLPRPLSVLHNLPPLANIAAISEAHKLQPEAQAALAEIGVPGDFSVVYDGPLRATEEPRQNANRFAIWMRATGQAGAYTAERLMRRYAEFCDVDHREPCPDNFFLGALRKTSGVRKEKPREGTRRIRWTIDPGKLGRAVALGSGQPVVRRAKAARRKLRKLRRKAKEGG